jgi:hypothetical protein
LTPFPQLVLFKKRHSKHDWVESDTGERFAPGLQSVVSAALFRNLTLNI